MPLVIKDILLASITILITYFGFIHNIELLQILIGILYAIASICIPVTLIFLYLDFKVAAQFKKSIKSTYKLHNFIISLFIFPITCFILYTTNSYNFLASYIILPVLTINLRYKIHTIVKAR